MWKCRGPLKQTAMDKISLKHIRGKAAEEAHQVVSAMSDHEAIKLLYDWDTWARPNQHIPPGEWTNWLVLAGRGFGKTRMGSEFIRYHVENKLMGRIALVAEDAGDARDVIVEGESGIIACSPPWMKPNYEPTKRRLTWPNGAQATIYADADPDSLRGPQHDGYWLDEGAKFPNFQQTWDNLMFGLRLGKKPRGIITTTPKPVPLIRRLIKDPENTHVTRGTTYENRANLADSFFREIIAKYEGTTLGRQEIYAEVIDPEEQGIVKRSWIQLWPAGKALPQFETVIQSYDTAFTDKTENDPTACTVWGVFNDGKKYCVMLIDAWSEHIQYPMLRARLVKEYNETRYGENEIKANLVLIEEKGSGISLVQELRGTGIPVTPYNPGRPDKAQRLHMVSNLIYNGLMYIPESTVIRREFVSWALPMVEQLCCFPLVDNDDYVDTTTQLLKLLSDQKWLVVDFLDEDDIEYYKTPLVNPYAV